MCDGFSSGTGFNIIGIQKGHLRYNVSDGITYQYIGGPGVLSSWRVVFGNEAYGQFSNIGNVIPADTNPLLVTRVADEMRGMSLVSSIGITIQEKGIYVVIDGGQIVKTGGGGRGNGTFFGYVVTKEWS